MKYIILALISALGFGISAPLAKMAFGKNMHPDGFSGAYLLGLLVIVAPSFLKLGWTGIYPNSGSLIFGMLAGISCAIGMKLSAEAMAIPGAVISVVTMLVALYPLITTFLCVSFLGEASKVVLPRLIIGSLMVIGGGILVSTSVK